MITFNIWILNFISLRLPAEINRFNRLCSMDASFSSRQIKFLKKQSVRESNSKLTAFPVKIATFKIDKKSSKVDLKSQIYL